jgi:hypothetical protein
VTRGWLGLLLLVATSSGCATLVRGTTQTIHFDCSPEGVVLRDASSGEPSWNLPADVTLSRRGFHWLIATKDGYRPADVYIRSEVSVKWYYLDLPTLGLGALFDAIAGGLYDLEPAQVSLVLEPAPQVKLGQEVR